MGAATKGTELPAATAWIKKLEPREARLAATVFAQEQKKLFTTDGKRDEAAIRKWLDELPLSDADKQDVLSHPTKFNWSPKAVDPYRSKAAK